MIQTPKVVNTNKTDFYRVLMQRVDKYFSENKLSKHADGGMVLKTIVMLSMYILPYVLIISGALVHRPEVIVVDEPMVGLDPKSARLLKDLFRQFVDRGGTVLMSTHTLEVAETMCDRIAIVHGGKIVAHGTMAEVQEQTSSEDLGLEELFLKLTGGMKDHQLDSILDS